MSDSKKHSKTECKEFMFSREYNLLKLKTDPESKRLAEEWRKEFVAHGLIAAPPVWANVNYRDRYKEQPLSPEQIRIRALVSEATVRALYVNPTAGSKENLSTLAADTSPEGKEKFRRIQDAAQEYGYVAKRQTPREPEPKPVQRETMLTLSPEQCQRIGLKPGTQVDDKQYLAIVTTIHDVDEQVAKQAAQAERDRNADESAATFGHVRETDEIRTWKAEQRAAIAVERALEAHDATRKVEGQ